MPVSSSPNGGVFLHLWFDSAKLWFISFDKSSLIWLWCAFIYQQQLQPLFSDLHSIYWCNWCYTCHSKLLKQYQRNWYHKMLIDADWMSNVNKVKPLSERTSGVLQHWMINDDGFDSVGKNLCYIGVIVNLCFIGAAWWWWWFWKPFKS